MSLISKWLRSRKNQCTECGAAMRLATIASCHGAHNNVSVWLDGLPYLECESGAHPKREPISDFAQRLIEEIYINDQIPWAELGALSGAKCLSCKTRLDAAGYENGEIGGEISIDDLPAFRARIQAMVIQCPACGTGQLLPDAIDVRDVDAAIRDALRSTGIVFS